MPRGKKQGFVVCVKANGRRATKQNVKVIMTNIKLSNREMCLLSSTTGLREDHQKNVIEKALDVKIHEVDYAGSIVLDDGVPIADLD